MIELFDEVWDTKEGASDEEIAAFQQALEAMGFPTCRLPEDYVALLKESNGGNFGVGDRQYQLLTIDMAKEYYEDYGFPEYMPYALPFAMDGGGCFFVFNMRSADDAVYFIPAGCLDWDTDCLERLAPNLTECIRSKA